jgi:hypothetical protein
MTLTSNHPDRRHVVLASENPIWIRIVLLCAGSGFFASAWVFAEGFAETVIWLAGAALFLAGGCLYETRLVRFDPAMRRISIDTRSVFRRSTQALHLADVRGVSVIAAFEVDQEALPNQRLRPRWAVTLDTATASIPLGRNAHVHKSEADREARRVSQALGLGREPA